MTAKELPSTLTYVEISENYINCATVKLNFNLLLLRFQLFYERSIYFLLVKKMY